MAGQVLAETQKIANGPPSPLCDYYRAFLAANGNSAPSPMTNAQIGAAGAGFWADMVRQGGQVVSP
jgi:hypothetical protein